MKRFLVRIYRWVLISVIIQVCVLFYFNNYYLNPDSQFKATSIFNESETVSNAKVKIPKGAANIKLSNNMKYACYMYKDNLEILDISTKDVIKKISSKNNQFNFYRWVPERNILVYSLNQDSGSKDSLELLTYDIDNDIEKDLPQIENIPAESEITDIEVSPLTGVIYAKVKISSKMSKIYRFDRMGVFNVLVSIPSSSSMSQSRYSDTFVYEDDNRVYVRDETKRIKRAIPEKNIVLLGIDDSDLVYLGKLDKNNQIQSIFHIKLDLNHLHDNTVVPLENTLQKEDILVSDNTVYRNNSKEKIVYDLKSGKKISYEGDLITIHNNSIAYVKNNVLYITVM